MSPDVSPTHRCQHGPCRPGTDGVRREREHGEELGAAARKVGGGHGFGREVRGHTLEPHWFLSSVYLQSPGLDRMAAVLLAQVTPRKWLSFLRTGSLTELPLT